jgi:excisionase family DNA binding protein
LLYLAISSLMLPTTTQLLLVSEGSPVSALPEFMTLPEVARLLRVANKTVYALLKREGLPAFKVGGQWRFQRADIDAWIAGRAHSRSQNNVRRPRRRTERTAK